MQQTRIQLQNNVIGLKDEIDTLKMEKENLKNIALENDISDFLY